MWEDLVVANCLKGCEAVMAGTRTRAADKRSYGLFTIEEFNERLIRFISADDQVCQIKCAHLDVINIDNVYTVHGCC